ncbi:hypothetical protein [Catenovulum maritimum]|uniref:Co-chaperone DjlA N-terminal domain-containing protein n=1 Tax=Catenovulum maritimum TaxID=1513271 RepID=A0A0J8GZY4_9ALTE|nr:hypothetical protein [Catenovulum maritimum]KMT66313.1 hypothetical protein XM47_04810 [Catenovulum maritimum]
MKKIVQSILESSNPELQQKQKEALLAIATLFSQVDGKIRLSEQDYIDIWLNGLEWNGKFDRQTTHKLIITQSRTAIENNNIEKYLISLIDQLSDRVYQDFVITFAKYVSEIDGEVATEEKELLALLTKLLNYDEH